MHRVFLSFSVLLTVISFMACQGSTTNKEDVQAPAVKEGAVMALSSDAGWSTSPDQNPIPPNWRPIFRWVANAEVDSMYRLFTEGMYFAIQDVIAANPQDARARLYQFYRDNPPRSFAFRHNGQSQSGIAQYAIGELETSTTTYRVTIVTQHGLIVSMDYELP